MPKEIVLRVEETLQNLRRSESHIDLLMKKLRLAAAKAQSDISGKLETWSECVHAKQAEAQIQVNRQSQSIRQEIVAILRSVVNLVNTTGGYLPLRERQILKTFLLSLPSRLNLDGSGDSPSSVVLLAHEAMILIKSFSTILARYLSWGKRTTTPSAPSSA